MPTKPLTTKIWKATRTSPAGMAVSETAAMMIGSEDVAIVADNRGITLAGPISIVADARNIRRGGLFVGLNDFFHMIPSSIVTPVPQQVPMPPTHGLINLKKDMAYFMSLLV